MEEIVFYLFDIDYHIVNDVAVIRMYGRTDDGRRICVKDSNFKPYFYIQTSDADTVERAVKEMKILYRGGLAKVTDVERVEKKLFGKKISLLKVYTKLPGHVPSVKEAIEKHPAVKTCFEFDILFARRYLIDKGITPLLSVKAVGKFTNEEARVLMFEADETEPGGEDSDRDFKILSFDLETYNSGGGVQPEKDPILMAAFYGVDEGKVFKRVISWKRFNTKNSSVEFVSGEAELVERCKEIIEQFQPDMITGYFSDGFDFPYLVARAKKYKIKFDIGSDYSDVNLGNRVKEAKVTGIVHLDVFRFIQRVLGRSLQTDSLKLDAVSNELLGERKHVVDLDKLAYTWDKGLPELETYAEYNLQDAYITYLLCVKILPNIEELVKIVGATLFEVNRMSFSRLVESYIMFQTKNYDEIIPNRPSYGESGSRAAQTYEGAFVYQPTPGLYKDLVVFDFRSLYPTIITSHNISPGTLKCDCCNDEVPGEEYWFCKKKKGFLPAVLENVITRRMRIKKMIKEGEKNTMLESRSNALKLLANSFYGYLGFAYARWYHLESAKSITAFGRFHIHQVIDEAKEEGFKVIYSDTDSIFLTLGQKTENDATRFIERINSKLPGLMELEYEGLYPAGIFVSAKAGAYGAKKKYALLTLEGNLKIKGFETVRRNWSFVAKETQEEVISIILRENDTEKAVTYVRDIVGKLRDHLIMIDKVTIVTQLQREVDAYDSIGPHVAVARKMKERGMEAGPGTLIKYVITSGKGILRERAAIPEDVSVEDYDADYYVTHQVIPAVDRIFAVLDVDIVEETNPHKQSKLGQFFG
jgi:DNA polymerase, archaea type